MLGTLLLFLIAVVLGVIHPVQSTTVTVHGLMDISDPEFFVDSGEGFSNVHITLQNNEDIAQSFVVLLQFQDSQGYTTQIVQSDLLVLTPDEELVTILDYRNETGRRMVDVFVWTGLEYAQPIEHFTYIGDGFDPSSYMQIPFSSETRVQLSRILASCEDNDPDCDSGYMSTLKTTYQRCMDFREFGVESSAGSICADHRLDKYAS